ncbi:M24 family metallopeptidase [Furfurilactobacillus milii]|uniref:M24 family metallopeptidase n=1 Tax=Furfurilactobacillus rossiae TaxID=231049 RepID=A0A7C9ISW4_9LACO|nr:Xaa-Pro peptidase family protein [Furfurilactobacillus milii]MYV05194.1 M24 family metallopeptidase [Furfurilactobacillus milii]
MGQKRVAKVQGVLDQLHLDAFLVTDEFNLHYLTGFANVGGDGCLLITGDQSFMITDARYETEMKAELDPQITLMITRDYYGTVVKLAADQNLSVIGFEDTLPYVIWSMLDEQLAADFVGLHAVVDHLREIKDADEIAKLRRAIRLSCEGYDALLPNVHVGMTEIEVANKLDAWMRAHGSTGPSFDTIVASGYRSAEPHGSATTKKLAKGELVTVDFGFYFDDYTSDITRTFALGQPDPELVDIYNLTKTANQAVIDVIKPGATGAQLDAAGRDLIKAAGYGAEFNHGMGHGIGLNIHEEPQVYGPRIPYAIQANQVITVEPGIYLPNLGGVRLEDDVLVTENGAEVLTTSSKDLKIL